MATKDFSIYFEPSVTTNSKVDISTVSGYNSIVQQIQHVARTQQNELISDMSFGSKIYDYIFQGNVDRTLINITMAAAIQSSIPRLSNVKAQMSYYSTDLIKFDVYFSTFDGVNFQKNSYCSIEVPL
jgi:hypothetical protein